MFTRHEALILDSARTRMVQTQLERISDARVLEAMSAVPRHLFVPKRVASHAYEDRPLPIGFGQTISQPLMVALMLEAAALRGSERVLEVGAGSGYQAALLSHLAREVYAIEIVPELASRARANLEQAQISGVHVITGDGSLGWAPAAPYDAIIVAAGALAVPAPLIEQLALGGRLLIPVGPGGIQVLRRITRTANGIESEDLGACGFVPLVGAYGMDPNGRNASP